MQFPFAMHEMLVVFPMRMNVGLDSFDSNEENGDLVLKSLDVH